MHRRHFNSSGASKSPRKSTIPLCVTKTTANTKRHLGSQCDFPSINLENLNSENYLDEEFKDFYSKCVVFINNYHSFLNKQLEGKFGCGHQEPILFKLPEVQNYVFLVEYLKECAEKKLVPEVTVEDSCLKNVVEKLSNTSIAEIVPEIKQLKEYKELEKQSSTSKSTVDSGFNSKESGEEPMDLIPLKINEKIPEMFIHPLQRQQEETIPMENRILIAEMIKQEISNYLNRNIKEKLTKTVINQVDIPGHKTTPKPQKMTLNPFQKRQLECFRQSLFDDDNSTILDDEEFEKLTSCEHSTHTSNPRTTSHDNNSKSEDFTNTNKPNPFKLNKRDLNNKEILSAIGIFTEKGEIRPDVLALLEKDRARNTNNSRNMKFRAKRNLEVTTKINTLTVGSTSTTSFLSGSSDIKSDSESELINDFRKQIR